MATLCQRVFLRPDTDVNIIENVADVDSLLRIAAAFPIFTV